MTRRPGKAPQTNSPTKTDRSTPRTHLRRHIHLTNFIHLKNHLHLQKHHMRMLDGRRTPQLPLRRELTAVRKVKALRDPSTSSSFSPVSVGSSSVTRPDLRANSGGAHRDEHESHETLRTSRRSNASEGDLAKGHPRGGRVDVANKRKDHRQCARNRDDQTNPYRGDGELDIGESAPEGKARGRGRRRDHAYPLEFSSQHKEGTPRAYRLEERWLGDAEEIARRLIAEQTAHMSSPHMYLSSLTRAHELSMLRLEDETASEDVEDFFLDSDYADTELTGAGHVGISSSQMSNSESPLMQRKPRLNARRPKDGMNHMRVGLHSRGRPRNRRSTHGSEYREAPVVPTMTDELDVSDIPQNGCGIPWYFSSLHKYKGKSLLDLAGMGFTCAFPETVKRKGDSKQVSRNGSRNGSQRDIQPPFASLDQSTFTSLDSDANVLTLLAGGEESYDEIDEPGLLLHDRDPPAREAPANITQTRKKKTNRGERVEETPVRAGLGEHRSTSQKYRPKSFKDLVGQSMVVKSLMTAITMGKVAPVYLFAGPRGTGKTSTARIFAAALVCLNTEPHRRPCGLCRECATLTLNRSRDVKEIDVASSPDLNHMRSLFGTVNMSPSNVRQRVFVVEGCDYLSTEVWTSFLKFLEDPPRNVVFILITTDLERLPLSATSRCQKYQFGKLKESEIVIRLQMLAEKENLMVEETALSLIASRADGSLRDAETTLDQLSLLDRTINLSMVQELIGLIPDNKLLDLLDLALAADTVNTVKAMRELLDSGVDALSLVAQLASLITNILGGTFDLRRESRKKGFFHRNMPRREEQQRLRQSLKVLAECEKQLRASNDRPTWLTAALLQFAPDRSYLPSSVDTSVAPSPIAFDTLEKVAVAEPDTPRLPPQAPSESKSRNSRKSQRSPKDIASKISRVAPNEKVKEKVSQEGSRKGLPTVSQLQAKIHPSTTESPSGPSEEGAGGGEPTLSSTLVLFDPARLVGSRDFRVLSRRDLEDVWGKVLEGCRSNVLRQLLSTHGTLMALFVARDDTYAVAHVEFHNQEHKSRAERLRSSTCHAFQMALGCPVELKLSLECPPSEVLEEIKASHALQPVPTTSGEAKDEKPEMPATMPDNDALTRGKSSSRHSRRRRKKVRNKQETPTRVLASAARDYGAGDVGSDPCSSSFRIVSRNFQNECMPTAGLSRRHRSGRHPSLNRAASGRPENSNSNTAVQEMPVKWTYPKFKGIVNIERRNMRLESQHRRTRSHLCWQSPQSEKDQGQPQLQPQPQPKSQRRRAQKRAAFFLRLVPCGRSAKLEESPRRP